MRFIGSLTTSGERPADIRIDIRAKGLVMRSLQPNNVVPRVSQIRWDGLTAAGVAAQGRLKFYVVGASGDRTAPAKDFKGKTSSGVYDHISPVRGRRTYGGGLGAGRGQQSPDLAASCGTKLVAARDGTVQTIAYQAGGAGFCVVIDGVDDDNDTGQPIGLVGSTGRSSGCHLHFEVRGAPGWFEGGAPMETAPLMRAWDAYS